MSRNSKTTKLIQAALFAALTAIAAFISVPLPFTPVPVTLATLSAMLAGTLLGPRYGSASQIVYLLVGAVGLPVFHNFTGGLGILTGPTGGFLIGYAVMAFTAGSIYNPGSSKLRLAGALTAATLLCYMTGTAWFMAAAGSSPAAAFISCIAPFIPGDILKIIAAVILTERLKLYIRR